MTVTVSSAALRILGLDDDLRFEGLTRVWGRRTTKVTGNRLDLIGLAGDIECRATEGEEGYNHKASEKAILRRAVAQLKKQGIEPFNFKF